MTVKRFNNAFGTTTDSPLSSTATTMNSQELPRLGAIATSGEFARLTLDPGYENGDPEIIHVTDYDGTATSATIERGKEGTTAREHASGTTWEHAPTVEDVNAGDASGTDATAVHPNATAQAEKSVSIGNGASAGASGEFYPIAIGHGASASGPTDSSFTARHSISLGANATDSGNGSCVILGGEASSTATGCVIIGREATSSARRGVAIGRGASTAGDSSIAIGYLAEANDDDAIAIGHSANASGFNPGIAIGNGAISGLRGLAIGHGADSDSHNDSIALGESVATSADSQTHIGKTHLALEEVSDPTTPPADEGRLYFRDDGSGTTELVALFPSGNSTVLATGAA